MARVKPLESGPIEKSRRRVQQKHRIVDEKHLAFVRSLPCVASGTSSDVIAHHLTVGRNRMGRKADDALAVPLNTVMHEGHTGSLHQVGEAKFWNALGIDPFPLAAALWENTGDLQRGVAEVMAARAAGKARKNYGVKIFAEKL